MTTTELRLLILVLGGLFVIGLYIWERRRIINDKHRVKDTDRHNRVIKIGDLDDELDADLKDIGQDPVKEKSTQTDKSVDQAEHQHQSKKETDKIVPVQPGLFIDKVLTSRHGEKAQGIKDKYLPKDNTSQQDQTSKHTEKTKQTDQTTKGKVILAISVSTQKKYMLGEAIMSAMRSLELQKSTQGSFYRYDADTDTALFHIVNMLEPGIFPFADMSRFTTTGITLFMQLPAKKSGTELFEDMYETAMYLCDQLDGKLLDDKHQVMVAEVLKEMRALASTYPAFENESQ